MWKSPGQLLSALTQFSRAWLGRRALGSGRRTPAELQGTCTIQVRMTRGSGKWWPTGTEMLPDYAQRTRRWAEEVGRMARIPPWDWAVATAWWRRAGRLGRLGLGEPWRWCAAVALWKDGWWRHTIRGLHYTDADPGRTLGKALGRDHPKLSHDGNSRRSTMANRPMPSRGPPLVDIIGPMGVPRGRCGVAKRSMWGRLRSICGWPAKTCMPLWSAMGR